MRICHIITRLIVGGAQENTLLTCEGLSRAGHDVTLVAGPETGPEGSLWNRARDADYDWVVLDSLRRAVRPFTDLRCLTDLYRFLRAGRFDVVHTHSSKAGILGRRAAARAGVPTIVHTIHGTSFNRTQPAAVQWFYRGLERRAARTTHGLITVADAMIEQSVRAGVAPIEKFTTVRSGIETDRFSPDPAVCAEVRAAWNVADDEVVIGTVARLFSHKGYEDILEAMPRIAQACPRARFVWVGDGACRESYVRRVEVLGLRDRLHLTGLLPPGQVGRVLNGFDLLVHTSRWEGLPRAVVQTLLCEVPAVSYDNDGAPEVVRPNETGFLVPLGDTAGLADAVVRLAGDADLRRRLGREGRRRCLEAFDYRRMVEQIESLYRRLRE